MYVILILTLGLPLESQNVWALKSGHEESDALHQSAEKLLELQKLVEVFEHQVESRIKPQRLALYAVSGYAVANTLGWWLDLDSGGPWFATSVGGAMLGVFSYLIPTEATRNFLSRLRYLRRLRKLLETDAFSLNNELSRLNLEKLLHVISYELLSFGILRTSLERWHLLSCLDQLLHRFETEVENREEWEELLGLIAIAIKTIRLLAIEQRDLPILIRSEILHKKTSSLFSEVLKSKDWSRWYEWMERQALSEESLKRSSLLSSNQIEEKELNEFFLSWSESSLRKPFLLQVRRNREVLEVESSSRFQSRLALKDLSSLDLKTFSDLKDILEKGVWIRFLSFESDVWSFYGPSDWLPFSESHSLGEIELASYPFAKAEQVTRIHLDTPLTGRQARAFLKSSPTRRDFFKPIRPWAVSCIRALRSF